MNYEMAKKIINTLTDEQLLDVLELSEGDEFNIYDEKINVTSNREPYFVLENKLVWRSPVYKTATRIKEDMILYILTGKFAIRKVRYTLKEGEIFYIISAFSPFGYIGVVNSKKFGKLAHEYCEERNEEYFKTKEKVIEKVKNLGWSIY